MKLGKLGEQIMLRSQKAFENIKYTGYEIAEGTKYYFSEKNVLIKQKEILQLLLKQQNLGYDCHFAINSCSVESDNFFDFFITSKVAKEIESGSPKFICGCSRTELAFCIFARIGYTPKKNTI